MSMFVQREKKENGKRNGKFATGKRIAKAKEANARFITQPGKRNETTEYGDRRKMWRLARGVYRKEHGKSVLSRSPLQGTSVQDETRMHVSV